MTEVPPIVLVRHGETDWSASRRHTSRTDVPLNAAGEAAARALAQRLPSLDYGRVWTSPAARARETARLARFPEAEVVRDIAEWDYGDYEGLTTLAIQRERPGWNLFSDGCPGGESVNDVAARADRVVAALREHAVPTLLFSSAHFLRVLGARWCGWPAQAGANLAASPASVSILSSEHGGADFLIQSWNCGA